MPEVTWYQLPEDECKRLNRTEMAGARWSLAALSSLVYAQDDLKERLKMIPDGTERWSGMVETLRSLMNDVLGTVPRRQCVTIKNVMNDMDLRMVPRYTPKANRVSMGEEDLSYLVDHAKTDICTACTLNGDECRTCELYRILESIAPQQDWGDSTVCPYMREDWFER